MGGKEEETVSAWEKKSFVRHIGWKVSIAGEFYTNNNKLTRNFECTILWGASALKE